MLINPKKKICSTSKLVVDGINFKMDELVLFLRQEVKNHKKQKTYLNPMRRIYMIRKL